MRSNLKIELKEGNDADPAALVTKALGDFQLAFDARLKDVETKTASNDNSKLADRLDKLEAKAGRPSLTADNDNTDTKLETKAFADYLRNPNSVLETKTLRVSSDAQGGYLAPVEFTQEFIRDLVLFSPIRSIATVKPTSFASVSLLKRTAITNSKWKGELADSEESEPAFGGLEIPTREINTFVDVSNQLLQDSAADVNAEVRLALAEDFGQKEGVSFVSGSGPLQPRGLLTHPDVETWLSGNATSVTVSGLTEFIYRLPAFYRNRGTWLMNGLTLASLRMLANTFGQPFWQPSLALGQPETLLGYPVLEIPDMPGIAANATPILFGDFKTAYRIVDRVELSTLVNPYSLATKGATRIHATRRVGADVVQPKAIVKLKIATA
ncbi:HK97 family phage major capsid protein [Bradyrhizobium sp. AZCC 1610]|uniref:phage major capsid protein n=1 Tax=Bradyrhizobium sp. AZCC 1610 TaxID=3117020 RepID=UPI002FF25A04